LRYSLTPEKAYLMKKLLVGSRMRSLFLCVHIQWKSVHNELIRAKETKK